jgi:hypothetical protein
VARYNEILVGRFNRFLQKFTAMKGEPPSPQLAGEIIPAIQIEDATAVEVRYLAGQERYMHRGGANAVAGQIGFVRGRNPVGSNVIAVLEKITVMTVQADTPSLFIGQDTADLATVDTITNSRLDLRGRPQPTIILSSTTAAAVTALATSHQSWQAPNVANSLFDVIFSENQEIPLLPGGAFQIANTIANQQIVYSIQWRERFLEDSERT